jgi:glycosyltransferase involved in cell wall biosynthesis
VNGRDRTAGTVGYLTKRFPRLSETFILDEIIGLERAGVPLRLFAVADPGERLTQPDVACVASSVRYIRGTGWRGIPRGVATTVIAHARLAAANPARYRAALAAARVERARTGSIRPFLDAGRLAIVLRQAKACHVHAAFAHGPASTARFVYLLTGTPYSFAAHAKDLYLSGAGELAAKTADAAFVLTCSAAAAASLAELAGSPGKIVLAYHGVNTERFCPREDPGVAPAAPTDQQAAGLPGARHQILAVGRLVAKKGYPVLLGALRVLVDGGRDVHCRIVGGGDGHDALARQIQQFGLAGRVTLAGARTHQEIAEEYRHADVFVQASVILPDGDRDGIPNALLEAMASSLPVVATAVSGIPEAVHDGITGLLVPPGDAAALAAALARVVDDKDLAARLGRRARTEVLERFDRRVCAAQIAQLFLAGHVADLPARAGVSR